MRERKRERLLIDANLFSISGSAWPISKEKSRVSACVCVCSGGGEGGFHASGVNVRTNLRGFILHAW